MSADRTAGGQAGTPAPADPDDELFPPLRGEEFDLPSNPPGAAEGCNGDRGATASSGAQHAEGHDDACEQALARVHAFLTNQLPASQADLIRAHLDACEKCLDDYDIEATISRLLKKSCGSPCAPDSLRLRVMTLRVEGDGPQA